MKKNLYSLACGLLLPAVAFSAYIPLNVSGFTADVVANGTGTALVTTTASVDASAFAFLSKGWQLTATSTPSTVGLPENGLINSMVAATPGLSFQLASYSNSNSARIATNGSSQVLTLGTPTAMKKLFILATSGDAASVLNGLITFTDGTTQPISNTTVPDWFNGTTPPPATTGFGRIGRNAASAVENPADNPRLYQIEIAILPANLNKQVASVTVTKDPSSNVNGILNVMALSAEVTTLNDAGVTSLVAPLNFCPGNQSIVVRVKNFGNNMINSAVVNWSINNTLQTPVNLTQPLDTIGGTGINETNVTLGNYNITGPVTLKAWTANPNNTADGLAANDTLQIVLQPALGGVYTVNGAVATGGTNYQSFTALATALNTYGICSPVTVNVVPASGPYNEFFSLNNIPGSSATNTLRINGNGATLQYATDITNRHMILLNGTKYTRIDSLNIIAAGTTYGFGAVIYNGAQYDSITNCVFNLTSATSTTSTSTSGIVFSNSLTSATTTGTNGSNCYIYNNQITGPAGSGGVYYGITLAGANENNIIRKNKLANFYMYGIWVSGGLNNLIEENEIHRATKTSVTTFYGVYATGSVAGLRINANRIHSPGGTVTSSTSANNPIYLTSATATAANPTLVTNNAIYNLTMGGTIYGVYVSTSPYAKVYHNTIDIASIRTGTSTNAGIYATGTNTGAEYKNNIISITGGTTGTKHGIYCNTAASVSDAQKNNIYMNSSQTGTQNYYYLAAAYATQAAFQTAFPAYEIGSPAVDPQYVAAASGNLMTGNSLLYSIGNDLLATVPRDINGTLRTTAPTVGAFQLATPNQNNARTISLYNLPANICATTLPVEAIIGNAGANNINTLTVNWSLNGIPQTPINYTSTLVPPSSGTGQSTDTILLGNAALVAGANTIKVWTSMPNGLADTDNTNDTISVTLNTTTFTLSPASDTICSSSSAILSLSPASGYPAGALSWESSSNGGTTWNPITGANAATYTVSGIPALRHYRAKITNGAAVCYSSLAVIDVQDVLITNTVPAERCGPGALNLSATGTGTYINWYAAATGGTALHTGATFTTPSLTNSTTYYVNTSENGPTSQQVYNLANLTPQRNWHTNTNGWGAMFTVSQNCSLDSLTIYPLGTGTITMLLLDQSNNILQTGTPVSVTGTGYTGTPVRIPVGFALTPGNYKLGQTITGLTNMGSQNIGTIGYPFSCPALSITSGSQGAGATANVFYWFYNWRVSVGTPSVGCESPRVAVTATINEQPVIDLGNDTLICPGTSTTLNSNTTTPGVSRTWSTGATTPTITVNTAGTYSVQVSTPKCTARDTIIVGIAPLPASNLTDTVEFCEGTTVQLDAGNTGADFLWNTGATTQSINVNNGGQYSVTVTNSHHCSVADTSFAVVNPLPLIDLGVDTTICPVGAIVLDAGNAGSDYLWSTGATTQTINVNQAGTYSVTVTNQHNCSETDTKVVSIYDDTRVDGFDFIPRFDLEPGRIDFSPINPQNVTDYLWDFGDGNTSTLQNPSHVYVTSGSYEVKLFVANDCGAMDTALTINVDPYLGVASVVNNNLDLKVYPVPAQERITIESGDPVVSISSLTMFNTIGQEVISHKKLNTLKTNIDISHIPSGDYFIRIETNKGTQTRKINIIH
ncbi:MAG: T9SS type A sorting domain-containing protein [Taibaiella sp.]|nr:T9SS type A sorting domain-containing protein [Taibaiella sp.]